MKKLQLLSITVLLSFAMMLTFASCSQKSSTGNAASTPTAAAAATADIQPNDAQTAAKPPVIPAEDLDPNGGADLYDNSGDHADSLYYKHPDFYNMASGSNITIIPHFKTMQQTTEWSCGNAAVLMALYNFGKTDVTEGDLAKAMGSDTDHTSPGSQPGSAKEYYDYGTNVKQIYDYLSKLNGYKVADTSYKADPAAGDLVTAADGLTPYDAGNLKPTFCNNSLYSPDNDDASENVADDAAQSFFVKWLLGYLQKGDPVLVEWSDWDGHWCDIIGYDNCGTPGIGDDMLIMADPYDTADQWQDGYAAVPLEKFFYMWNDRNVAPKPYQLQQYIVIEKAN